MTPSVLPPSSSSITFDPFESFQQTSISNDLFQPMNPSSVSTTANKAPSNGLDLFMTPPTQSTQQSSMFFPTQQQQQPFVRPAMFQQPQSMMFSSTQQQFNKPNNNSFNVS
jgi:hypothetical protein